MERRLQLLLDAERYRRVEAEAKSSGRSVSAVIREAIDVRFPEHDVEVRAKAARDLLAMTESMPDGGRPEGPAELKRICEESMPEKEYLR